MKPLLHGVALLEIANLAVATGAMLLPELHRHLDRIRREPRTQEGLIELHRILLYWATAAKCTNTLYENYLRDGGGDFDDFEAPTGRRSISSCTMISPVTSLQIRVRSGGRNARPPR